jgi:hypothetical protein
MRAEEVAEQIRQAFSTAPYPGDNRLTQGSSIEATQVSNFLKGPRWQDLGVEELAPNHESLFFMTREAIRYYIPAFLIASVRNYDNSDKIPGTLLFFLNPHAMRDSEYASRFRERFDIFDDSERGAIRVFLEYLRDTHSEDFPTSTGRDEASQLIQLWSN